jgi:AcrR family transcriptional regulator
LSKEKGRLERIIKVLCDYIIKLVTKIQRGLNTMPRAFTEHEKQRIKIDLLEKGKEMLGLHGIRKTNVEDLTRAAGISKGAFYKFFPSKEVLFFEILEELENEMRKTFFSELLVPGHSPRESFRAKMKGALAFIDENPLMGKISSEEMNHLIRTLPREKLEAHSNKDDRELNEWVTAWKDEGYLKDHDPNTVAALIKSLFILALQKHEIGQEHVKVMNMMLDMASQYLINDWE